MNTEQANKVCEWLTKLDGIVNAVPVKVTITHKKYAASFYGARYGQVRKYEQGERAVTEGDKKAGDEHVETKYYLLGKLPKTYRKKRINGYSGETCQAIVYRIGDDSDWYVCSYFEGEPNGDYQPFGRNFMLSRWPHENPWHGRIDHYDDKPRERVNVTVEVLLDGIGTLPREDLNSRRTRFTVAVPGDLYENISELAEHAIEMAREDATDVRTPAVWEVDRVSGDVGDHEVIFSVFRLSN